MPPNNFDFENEKAILVQNLTELKSLQVEDFTFRKKYEELQKNVESRRYIVGRAKDTIWRLHRWQWDDELKVARALKRIEPGIIFADTKRLDALWNLYRRLCHSGEFSRPPKTIKFFVVDYASEYNEPPLISDELRGLPFLLLGIGAISADFPTLDDREEFIGWGKDRFKKQIGRLRNVAVASTISATQPFGYNFNGGKLIALLTTSETIRNEWQLRFGDVLAGITTTSLYGSFSMYTGLEPWWERIGATGGKQPIQPRADIYKRWTKYIREKFPERYQQAIKGEGDKQPTNSKGKILNLIYQTAGIKKSTFEHGYQRGAYFSEAYENTKDFLCENITEDELRLQPFRKASSSNASDGGAEFERMMEWWREQAYKRYLNRKQAGKLQTDVHFYGDMYQMDFETAKEVFGDDVGR